MSNERSSEALGIDAFLDKQRTQRGTSVQALAVESLAGEPNKVVLSLAAGPFPPLAVRLPKNAIKHVRTTGPEGGCNCGGNRATLEVSFEENVRELIVDLLNDMLLQYGQAHVESDQGSREGEVWKRLQFPKCNMTCMDGCYGRCQNLETGSQKRMCIQGCHLSCCRY